jgi:hypothetical protein
MNLLSKKIIVCISPLFSVDYARKYDIFIVSTYVSFCRYAMIFSSRAIFLPIHRYSKWCFPRSFGTIDRSPTSFMRNAEVQTIYTETLNIPNQGRLEVRCPFNLYVTPLNQKDFPRLDKAFFTIYGRTFSRRNF